MRRIHISIIINIICVFSLFAQQKQLSSSEILDRIQKVQFLGSALYVAAHPDDENTKLISYLANETKAHTAYLSLTRGDGGQNLIGTELKEDLGVLRTQELMAARRIDGGNQMFSRAVDFGYSKHPDETLTIWPKDEVMSDVVWAIRKFQPDIIVNRFDHRSPGRTHGHHTASAMLSYEAFDIVNDPSVYPSQLRYVSTWQPSRLFFNTSWWFYGSREKFEEADKSKMATVDIGVYYPLRGKSNNEIAANSRSQHKCQGFGRLFERGQEIEYLEFLKGDDFNAGDDLFKGINTTWSRVQGGEPLVEMFRNIEQNFKLDDPTASIPQLLEAKRILLSLEDSKWKEVKGKELDEIIANCLGLFVEVNVTDEIIQPNSTVKSTISILNRSDVDVLFEGVSFSNGENTSDELLLENNVMTEIEYDLKIGESHQFTTPYWLREDHSLGMFTVADQQLIGLAENPPEIRADFRLSVTSYPLLISVPVIQKLRDPVKAEIINPLTVLPEITINIDEGVYIFRQGIKKTVTTLVQSHTTENTTVKIEPQVPLGWTVIPKSKEVELSQKGEIKEVQFELTPTANAQNGNFEVQVTDQNNKTYDQSLTVIDYDHITKQHILKAAEAKLVYLNINKKGQKVGYVMGAGDEVPEAIRQIGYDVDLIEIADISESKLKDYDAIVLGIRAYNTKKDLKFKQDLLLDYVNKGGTMIVQYNTSRRFEMDNLGPYPLKLSRDRVTDEHAKVTILNPQHEVLNNPNKITETDFDGWIQERGLYFPDTWDDAYTPIFAMNDKGEDPKKGSLLVADYGDGHYIYTGISFFRELPAGVPGAYRLMANLLSLGN